MSYQTVAERRAVEDYVLPPDEDHPVVLTVGGAELVEVGRVNYRSDLVADIYYPPGSRADERGTEIALPVVIQTNSFTRADLGENEAWVVNSRFLESYSQLLAAAGVVTVVYSCDSRLEDLGALMQYLDRHSARLGLGMDRIGVFAQSGHGALGLHLLTATDKPYSDGIQAGLLWHCILGPVAEFRTDVPLMVIYTDSVTEIERVRIGNKVLVERARAQGVPLTVISDAPRKNHATLDDTEESRRIIRASVDYLAEHLGAR